jgi:hypothetical protein
VSVDFLSHKYLSTTRFTVLAAGTQKDFKKQTDHESMMDEVECWVYLEKPFA